MHRKYLSTIVGGITLNLIGCASIDVSNYQELTPYFSLEQFFNGSLSAHGIVKNRSGKVIRYFNAELQGYWEADQGTLKEVFIFENGERQLRTWHFKKYAENRYIGTAADVVGEAELTTSGNALFLDYTLAIPWKGRTINVHIDDRMYLTSDDTLINESVMRKFGFKVGSITLTIIKKTLE